MHRLLACPACPQLLSLLAKVDDWGYDTMALDDASNGHALSVLGFVFITRTEAFKKFRLDENRLAKWGGGLHIHCGVLDSLCSATHLLAHYSLDRALMGL